MKYNNANKQCSACPVSAACFGASEGEFVGSVGVARCDVCGAFSMYVFTGRSHNRYAAPRFEYEAVYMRTFPKNYFCPRIVPDYAVRDRKRCKNCSDEGDVVWLQL